MHFIYNASLAFDQESDCVPSASHSYWWERDVVIRWSMRWGKPDFFKSGFVSTDKWFSLPGAKKISSLLSLLIPPLTKAHLHFSEFLCITFNMQVTDQGVPESLLLEQRKHNCTALLFLSYVEENGYGENSPLRERVASSCCSPPLLVLPSTSRSRGDTLAERPAVDETANLWLCCPWPLLVQQRLFS